MLTTGFWPAVTSIWLAVPETLKVPVLSSVIVPPSETVPPPVMPVPALTVRELLASSTLSI